MRRSAAGPSSTSRPWPARSRGRRSPGPARRAARRTAPRCRSSSATRRRTGSSRSTITGARPRLISSTSRTRGALTSARPTASICCSPPDSSAGLAVQALLAARAAARAARRGCGCPWPAPSRRCSRAVRPENSARPSGTSDTPRPGEPVGGHARDVLAVEPDPARRAAAAGRRSSTAWWSCRRRWRPSSATTSPAPTCRERSRTTGDAVVAGVERRRPRAAVAGQACAPGHCRACPRYASITASSSRICSGRARAR